MNTAVECGLIVFLRYPEKGKIKTRIASTLGEEAALAIYKELTSITLQLVSKLPLHVYLFYEGGIPSFSDQQPFILQLSQAEGDLGDKMLHAFKYVLDKHNRAVIIGSDCPELSREDILEAFHHLDRYDLVIGPSEDGGYYLLGCKELIPSIFENMNWSTSSVTEDTIRRIENQHKTYCLLRPLTDIDDAEDWARFKKNHPG